VIKQCTISVKLQVQRLREINILNTFGSLKLNNNSPFRYQIRKILANHYIIIIHLDRPLLFDLHPIFYQLMCHSIFVYLFKKTRSKRITHFISRINDFF